MFQRTLITANHQASMFKIGLTVKNGQGTKSYFEKLLKEKAD
jgi:hypothetical protein